ncbi:alcohol oxidase [Rhizodiscina lignyota]|uniref:Alcohol oxidase n=1 Tax=Rhizodiscina lignyota TaxID=1504668 RepID=A0A9P4IRU4_9PEZI|nr:alcohol oxidase [Rhizodiscina lignyota]
MSINTSQSTSYIKPVDEFVGHAYDYVIIGGGASGLAVAARLTENPKISVAVIEAGKNNLGDPLVDTPALFTQMYGRPDYDWNLMSVPQAGHKNKVHHMVRGKMLGGSSGLNFMLYNRGSDSDYDDWAALVGDAAWSAQSIKSYMRKSQTLEPIDDEIKEFPHRPVVALNHGTSGPVRTSFNVSWLPIEDDILEAAKEVCGLSEEPKDPCNGDRPGFMRSLGSIARTGPNKGMRSYAARSYYEQNQARPNLSVICDSLVLRIVLDGGNVARGVEFEHAGETYTISARHEVIVCAGAIQTPQILELSGIGDPDILKQAGVESKIELRSVGNNFQDHLCTGAAYEFNPGVVSLDAIWNPQVMESAQREYQEEGRGPLSSHINTTGFFTHRTFATEEELRATISSIRATQQETSTSAFYKAQLERIITKLEHENSDLQLIALPVTLNWQAGPGDQGKLSTPLDPAQAHGMSMFVGLQYPVSRGTVHITSSDPKAQPAIDPAYLKHPADVAVLAAGVKFAEKVAASSQLSDKIAKRTLPLPEVKLSTTEDAKAHVRDFCTQEYHSCGTCAMGEVVDTRLRVKGVKGLRVCDASVFPAHVSGNIISTVYAIAEKAADMIKEDWKDGK